MYLLLRQSEGSGRRWDGISLRLQPYWRVDWENESCSGRFQESGEEVRVSVVANEGPVAGQSGRPRHLQDHVIGHSTPFQGPSERIGYLPVHAGGNNIAWYTDKAVISPGPFALTIKMGIHGCTL